MKIAFVTARRDPTMNTCDNDGGNITVKEYINQLLLLGHEIHVFTRYEGNGKHIQNSIKKQAHSKKYSGKYKIKENLYIHYIEYRVYPNYTLDSDIRYLHESISFAKQVAKVFKKETFDIIHYFHFFSISGFIFGNLQIPYKNISIYSPLLPSLGRSYEQCIFERISVEQKIFEQIPFIASPSKSEKDVITKYYTNIDSTKIEITPRGYEPSIFFPIDFESRSNFIIYPNSFRPQKRQEEFINLTSNPRIRDLHYKCIMVGEVFDIAYYNRLKEMLTLLGEKYCELDHSDCLKEIFNVKEQFVFISGLDQKKLSDLLRISRFALFTSRDETFGKALLEALACGCCSFCYNLPAYREFTRDGFNSLYLGLDQDPSNLCKLIRNMLSDSEKAMQISRQAVLTSKEFTWSKVVKDLERLYVKIHTKFNANKHD